MPFNDDYTAARNAILNLRAQLLEAILARPLARVQGVRRSLNRALSLAQGRTPRLTATMAGLYNVAHWGSDVAGVAQDLPLIYQGPTMGLTDPATGQTVSVPSIPQLQWDPILTPELITQASAEIIKGFFLIAYPLGGEPEPADFQNEAWAYFTFDTVQEEVNFTTFDVREPRIRRVHGKLLEFQRFEGTRLRLSRTLANGEHAISVIPVARGEAVLRADAAYADPLVPERTQTVQEGDIIAVWSESIIGFVLRIGTQVLTFSPYNVVVGGTGYNVSQLYIAEIRERTLGKFVHVGDIPFEQL